MANALQDNYIESNNQHIFMHYFFFALHECLILFLPYNYTLYFKFEEAMDQKPGTDSRILVNNSRDFDSMDSENFKIQSKYMSGY